VIKRNNAPIKALVFPPDFFFGAISSCGGGDAGCGTDGMMGVAGISLRDFARSVKDESLLSPACGGAKTDDGTGGSVMGADADGGFTGTDEGGSAGVTGDNPGGRVGLDFCVSSAIVFQ